MKEEAGPHRKAWLKVVRFTDHSEARSVKKKCAVEGLLLPPFCNDQKKAKAVGLETAARPFLRFTG